jgi:hypothetical protein
MRQRPSVVPAEEKRALLARLRNVFETHFAYFNEGNRVCIKDRHDDHWRTGLKLPADVLHQFYVDSARTWYPGL